MQKNQTTRPTRRSIAVACGCLLPAAAPTFAQDTNESRGTLKVEVTGSHIKRADGESALPVQIITRDEIDRAGWATAAELMAHVSANLGGFNDQLSIGQFGTPGLASADLRGLGDGNTLVLLNGRRLANYAFFGATANLNSIPLAAVERVEILKDGASSIYGTDAIAGVINFITRKDYSGVDLSGQAAVTEHGGADRYQATVTAGYGNLARDRFNAFVTVDRQKEHSLPAHDRAFARTALIPSENVNGLSSATFPANIFDPNSRLRLNPSYGRGCSPPTSVPFPGRTECGFDYASVIDIIPPTERTTVLARATWQWAPDHQLFAEYLYAYNDLLLRASPTPANPFPGDPVFLYPANGPFYPTAFAVANGLSGDLILNSYRAVTLGPRTDEVRTWAQRLVLGGEGTVGQWSYSTAFNHSEDTATDTYTGGLMSRQRFYTALATGLINPFGPSGAEGDALLASTQINGEMRRAKGTVDQVDARISADVYNLPAGAVAIALGAEARRERLQDTPNDFFISGDVLGGGGSIEPQDASRRAQAMFLEIVIPVFKTFDAQLSARYDHYSDFGGTTNPKVALRWQPIRSVLVRGSWGTGFRAPTLPDLFTAQTLSGTVPLDDPIRCPVTSSPFDCETNFLTRVGGNPNLQPEKSTQYTAGVVWEPVDGISLGAEYWNIEKHNVIGSLDDFLIFDNYDLYGPTHVVRGPPDAMYPTLPGPIQYVIEWNENIGNVRTSGIDFDVRARSPATGVGRFTFRLDGTYIIDASQQLPGLPIESGTGNYRTGFPFPRWRHFATLGWDYGPWNATLAQTFQQGYEDSNLDRNGEPIGIVRRVGTNSIWDLQGAWTGFKNTTIALGVKNIFDRAPPFSNQRASFQVGYDPIYGDPRGRTFYTRLSYAFK